MSSNLDGYDTESVDEATQYPLELKNRRAKKTKTQNTPTNPIASSSVSTTSYSTNPILHPTCTLIPTIDVLKTKLRTLQSLQTFDVVQKNQNFATSLRTFEALVNQQCNSPPTTSLASTIVTQIDGLENAIYQLECIFCGMAKLNLSQSKQQVRNRWQEWVKIPTWILFSVVMLYIVLQTDQLRLK